MKPPEAKQWHLGDRDIHRVLHTYSRRRMGMHWPLRPPRNYPALYATKIMTTHWAYARTTYSSQTETGRDSHLLTLSPQCLFVCACVHTYTQTKSALCHKKEEIWWRGHLWKTGHTNFLNYVASRNSVHVVPPWNSQIINVRKKRHPTSYNAIFYRFKRLQTLIFMEFKEMFSYSKHFHLYLL